MIWLAIRIWLVMLAIGALTEGPGPSYWGTAVVVFIAAALTPERPDKEKKQWH